jgi:hypothetical protein
MVDSQFYRYLWTFAKKRHPDKVKRWIVRKYWLNGSNSWIFSAEENTPEGKHWV